MYNLIKADLFKLRKSIAIKVIFLIAMLSSVIMTIMAYMMQQGKLGTNSSNIGFMFSDANVVAILGGTIAAVFICGDFDNRTIHEAIVDGNSRGKVVISKAIMICLGGFIILLPYIIITGIAISTGYKFSMGQVSIGFLNLITSEGGKAISSSQAWKILFIILVLTISHIAQISVCIPLAIGLKKPAIVVPVYYGGSVLLGKIGGLQTNSKIFKTISECTPFSGKYSFMTLNAENSDIVKGIVFSLIFIIVMTAITCFAFRKSEIK